MNHDLELEDDRGAHSIYRNNLSSTRVNALESRNRPFRSTAIGFREHAIMTAYQIYNELLSFSEE